MTMPVSRVLGLLAAALVGFVLLVALQPAGLEVSRKAPLGGRLDMAQEVLGDVARLPSWAPGMSDVSGRVQGTARRGKGARLEWGGGDAHIEEASDLHTKVRVEIGSPRPERFVLAVDLDDPGAGLVGTMTYHGDPRGFVGKIKGLLGDPEERIAARLDAALVQLGALTVELEAERARTAKEQKEAAAKAAAAELAAIKAAREQNQFTATLEAERRASGASAVEPEQANAPRRRRALEPDDDDDEPPSSTRTKE